VKDPETDLSKENVRLFIKGPRSNSADGQEITSFRYDPATDKLSHTPRNNLAFGRHKVKVEARDAMGNVGVEEWSFKIEHQ